MPRTKLYILRESDRPATPSNNLPAQPTPLIGREADVESVCLLLEDPDVTMVTLLGPGGVGKTRLSLQVAEELLSRFPGGVYFVELASATDTETALSAIADVLGVSQSTGVSLVSTLKQELVDKQALLLLDNFEQIIPAAPLVADLLSSCPNLKVLVTSRSPLRLRAEREYNLAPLALPDTEQRLTALKASQSGAVALFVERARSVNSTFELTDINAGAVAEVCTRLDGLPLAIELVAAHARVMPPQSILTRLTRPLHLLTGGPADAVTRHQNLRDTIDWSYRLLTEDEQRLFRRLAVFSGGFSLRAAEAVCNNSGDIFVKVDSEAALDVMHGIGSLIEKSLVRRTELSDSDDPRFGMLETVREYATEQFIASGEKEEVLHRHAYDFLSLAVDARAGLELADMMDWVSRMSHEHDNLRAAQLWFVSHPEAVDDTLRMLQALQHYWARRTTLAEFTGWLEAALQHPNISDRLLQIWALRRLAILKMQAADYTASMTWAQQSRELALATGDKLLITETSNLVAQVAALQGDYALARPLMESALVVYRELDREFPVAGTLINLGAIAHYQGDYERSVDYYRESLGICRRLDNKSGILNVVLNMGHSLRHLGRLQESRTNLMEALTLAVELEGPQMAADALTGLASLILSAQTDTPNSTARMTQVTHLSGAAAGLLERSGRRLEPLPQAEFEANVAVARSALDEPAFTAAWQEGLETTLAKAIELAERNTPAVADAAPPPPKPAPRAGKQNMLGLTRREYEVTRLVAQGMSNGAIAAQLVLSERTVEMHVSNSMHKFGLATRTQLAAWAVQNGLITNSN